MGIPAQLVTVLQSPEVAREAAEPMQQPFPLDSPAVMQSAIYRTFSALLRTMGLDRSRQDSGDWNPLGDLISPGEAVLIKPNLVYHEHYRGGPLHGVVTDPRLIRAVADYIVRAMGPTGKLVIGDAPLQSANWKLLCERTGIHLLPEYYSRHGFRCELRDFRTLSSTSERGLKVAARRLGGDPAGYRAVDLGSASLHSGRNWEALRVTNYDPSAMKSHHNAERHEYLVSGSVLEASTVFNLSKLKTHRKTGLTGPLKNLIGINGCKDWLPHHTKGSADRGGDEYRSAAGWKALSTWLVEREETAASEASKRTWNALRRSIWFAGKRVSADSSWEGSWFGNDTLWRTIVDLNRAATYANAEGTLCQRPQRRFFAIVDATLAGEGEGPMAPAPVPMGTLLAGLTPAAVEHAACRLAGWPVHRMRTITGAFAEHRYPLAGFPSEAISIEAYRHECDRTEPVGFEQLVRFLRPSQGWRGLFDAAHPEELCGSLRHAE